jgi:hypothetical protein
MMAELQDVFALHWDGYRLTRPITFQQQKAADAIVSCRTSTLDGHVEVCGGCGHEKDIVQLVPQPPLPKMPDGHA